MDDANVPVGLNLTLIIACFECALFQSLLSLPYLGFLDKSDENYVKTRELLLSGRNPYFSAGKNFSGIGYVDFYRPLQHSC